MIEQYIGTNIDIKAISYWHKSYVILMPFRYLNDDYNSPACDEGCLIGDVAYSVERCLLREFMQQVPPGVFFGWNRKKQQEQDNPKRDPTVESYRKEPQPTQTILGLISKSQRKYVDIHLSQGSVRDH